MKFTRLFIAAVLLSPYSAASPATTPSDRVPPPLQRVAACMLQVLKAAPGVHNAKLGVSTSEGWAHPFLEYEPDEQARSTKPTRFDAIKWHERHGPYAFIAIVPGLTPSGEVLDYHVSREVVLRWKARCGVLAGILLE